MRTAANRCAAAGADGDGGACMERTAAAAGAPPPVEDDPADEADRADADVGGLVPSGAPPWVVFLQPWRRPTATAAVAPGEPGGLDDDDADAEETADTGYRPWRSTSTSADGTTRTSDRLASRPTTHSAATTALCWLSAEAAAAGECGGDGDAAVSLWWPRGTDASPPSAPPVAAANRGPAFAAATLSASAAAASDAAAAAASAAARRRLGQMRARKRERRLDGE